MFITLEGIEGSGKTTQVKEIDKFLQKMGHDCIITREPGGTGIGKKIRGILLDPENSRLDHSAELLLYAADRSHHIKTIIQPALAEGKTVICDRFSDATTAYQGFARGLDMKKINLLQDLVLDGLKPDITILFDLPAETGLKRAWNQIHNGARTHLETRFEKEAINFHKKVRSGYLKLAQLEPKRFCIINAALKKDRVKKEIINILTERL